jgi:ketosteroid isomerase-like protein
VAVAIGPPRPQEGDQVTAGTGAGHNRRVVASLWRELYERDFEAVASHFHPDGEYTDVASPSEDVARGRDQIAARLRLGLAPLEAIDHDQRLVVAEGDVVVTEHVEHWRWPTGEHVALPFVSIHEFRDGLITRWWDYWDMPTLMAGAPQWWIEHIMEGYR